MSTFLRAAGAVLVALLTLAMVAVIVSWTADGPIGQQLGQNGSATPSASADPSATAAPSLSSDDVLSEIEAQVVEIRGLPAPDIEPVEVINRAQLADELAAILDETWTEEELARSNLILRAMGLLDDDQDLRALTEQLYAGQVLGFYDPLDERMVVVSDAGLTVEARITYAHEFTHAIQDAAFDTFDERDALTDDDAILALQALEEGDATVVMFQWAFGHLSEEEMMAFGETPLPDTSGIPDWMVRQLEFPYLAGFTFVNALATVDGWEAVDAAYADPPVSTEQVLHPEKYLDREPPITVEADALAATLGDGWEDLEATTIGEAMVEIWLAEIGVADSAAGTAAVGWGGDRLAVASGPDGAWAMAWRLAWDSAADGDEFAAAYAGADAGTAPAVRLIRVSPTEALVLHAASGDVLTTLEAALGG